jgi:hypothetical protein
MTDYNGWTNRNTWLINLHFGDVIREELQEDASNTAETISNYILDILQYQEDNAHSIIRDFIDISGINWQEIYETIALDVFVGGEA